MIAWLPGMLAAPAPTCAEVSAAEYCRPDDRFAPGTNAARIALAQDHAAEQLSGAALADDFNATWQEVDRLCRAEPEGRVVRTRHGDPMLLSEFLLTRVVEVAVHGLDLADVLGCQPWLTAEAADLVQGLLLGPVGAATLGSWAGVSFAFCARRRGASRSRGRKHRTSAAWASDGSRWDENVAN
ncbi:maleylpyruvate isomerase N-terminal domain-containing protein [Streptomyces mirabilis]|uniref:maleylpyruvate isomerase N-terminal domain-containing protein n=1 Tax=Streptomyces mirabilis TaxID=68239 RepID=UPI0036DB4113